MRGRGGRWAITLSIVVVAAAIPAASGRATAANPPSGDTTISVNPMRTGWDSNEPDLDPATVTASSFGQLFSHQVQGQVFAAPLVVDRTASSPGVLIVATEDDLVYGLSPVDGHKVWEQSLGTPWSASVLGCGDLTPHLGITATPVYDPNSNTVYVLAKEAPNGATSSNPAWYLHALDAATGAERGGWPTQIGGHPDNDPTRTFNAKTAGGRAGLLLLNGVVYAGFASHCDIGPYNGYVAGVSTTTAKQTALFSVEAGTNSGQSGIWQSGGGLMSDGDGQIIVATGNGDIAPASAGDHPPTALGEAVARLTVQPNGTLKATDYFSPINGASLNQVDADLGSGGPMAIPDGYGTAAHPHLLVQVGKDAKTYLLDRDHLGGNGQGPSGSDDVLGATQIAHGVWGHPAFWGGSGSNGGYVYVVENAGTLRALHLGSTGAGLPVVSLAGNSQATFGYTSGSPIVTSNGNAANSALVWVVSVQNGSGTGPMLRAYDAKPDGSGILGLAYSAPLNPPGVTDNSQAHGAKFTTVATDNGRVFVGTRDGYVFGFGHPSSAPLVAPPTDLGSTAVNHTSAPVDVTLLATRNVTVNSVSASPPFSVTSTQSLPTSLDVEGSDALTVDLTMTPTTPGDQSGTLTVGTNEGPVSFGITGYGTKPGLAASPSALDFGTVALPGHSSEGIGVTNTSGVDETVSSVSPLSPPFSSPGLPSVNQVIPAGASLAIPITYSPTTESAGDTGHLTIGIDNDPAQTLNLDFSGNAIRGSAKLQLRPTTLHFGLVPRAGFLTKTFEIQNQGNVLLTINKAKAPFGAFTTNTPVSEGQQITPDQAVIQSVTFHPTKAGTTRATYLISTDDGTGAHLEQLVGTDDQLTDRYVSDSRLQHVLGGPNGFTRAVGAGYLRSFRGGRMFWSNSAGIHEVHGAVLHRYQILGGPAGHAGFPTTDVKTIAGGLRSRFSGSWAIYWSAATGAHTVHGTIAKRWLRMGGQRSTLGYPTGEPHSTTGGIKQRFEHGTISWSKGHGFRVIHH